MATTVIPPAPQSRKWLLIALALLLGVGGAVAWQRSRATYHLATVETGVLYRDGARSARELAYAVEKVKAKTVVSLVDAEELADPNKPQFQQEATYLTSRGLHQVRIPVKLGGYPTTDDIRSFLSAVQDPSQQPVLLHCAQGVRRTAMFVAAYQESVLGYDKLKAKQSIVTFGHSERTVSDIEHFIDRYDAASRKVMSDMPDTTPS